MAWCSLYSTALKYKIAVRTFHWQYYVVIAECFIIFLVALFCAQVVAVSQFGLSLVMTALVIVGYGFYRINIEPKSNKTPLMTFVLLPANNNVSKNNRDTNNLDINKPHTNNLHTNTDISNDRNNAKSLLIFELDLTGILTFNPESKWQLLPASKISFWGCYLSIKQISQPQESFGDRINEDTLQLYFFKWQLSEQDYARLSRVIVNLAS